MTAQQRIEKIRKIAEEYQVDHIEGYLMDATTASMLVKIFDALNEVNREKFASLPVLRMVDVGWSLCK